jgi:hypothetical protein
VNRRRGSKKENETSEEATSGTGIIGTNNAQATSNSQKKKKDSIIYLKQYQ